MRITKDINEVYVLGEIWMPYGAHAATTYTLDSYALGNLCDGLREKWSRDAVERWLLTNSGDFSHVIDFSATCRDWPDIPWADEDHELEFNDLTYPVED